MLDPRIYRMGFIPVLLAVIVLAFSLEDQPGALSTSIVPDAFSGGHAYATMQTLATQYPSRAPGSIPDRRLAGYVAGTLGLHGYGFRVSTDTFQGPTPQGTRTLENVIGVRAGGGSGSVVIVSHRDATGSRSAASLSGTAVMLELARVLSGQTLNRTLVMVSTSGSVGAVGTERLVSQLPGPIDAVLVLGDLAGPTTGQPVITPWSDGLRVAPPTLRNTVSSALTAQTGLAAGGSGLAGQVAHLAFPMSTGEQAPIVGAGGPAVLLSVSGEREPPPNEVTSATRITGMGRAALAAVTALQDGPAVASPSTYLLWNGKVIPAWSVRLLALLLILPVLAVTVDGMARARRRGHSISRWIVWVVASAVPFILAALLVLIAHATGWIAPAPPIPPEAGKWPLGAGGIALLVVMGLVIVAGLIWLRPLLIGSVGLRRRLVQPVPAADGSSGPGAPRRDRDESSAQGAGAAAGVLVVMCVVALAVWLSNPFAALLLAPALHLWLWVVTPDIRLPIPVTVLFVVVGLAPVALLAAYFATTLGLGPVGMAWTGVLMLAGGGITLLGVIEWSLLAGCAISVVAIALRAQTTTTELPVTVRGPVSYAGPGSLGGTESALRR